MSDPGLTRLLEQVQGGQLGVAEALKELATWPFEDLDFVKIDHHRSLRKGSPEVIFGENKTREQLLTISQRLLARHQRALATRVGLEDGVWLADQFEQATFHQRARLLTVGPPLEQLQGLVVVASAGTSDLPVAEEAALTLGWMGSRAELVTDVGVAGLHRLLGRLELLRQARAVVVVAGMDGALASVIGGLVACPVVAVPTSVGYGACFGGVAPLLTMLNSCAPGVTVVNIDNGFGGGYAAHRINLGTSL